MQNGKVMDTWMTWVNFEKLHQMTALQEGNAGCPGKAIDTCARKLLQISKFQVGIQRTQSAAVI